MGRKPKPDHRKYSERVAFMTMPHEYAAYNAAADAANKDLSEWARDSLNEVAKSFMVEPDVSTVSSKPKSQARKKAT